MKRREKTYGEMREEVFRMLHDMYIVAALCRQWGDSGKGKIVDLLAWLWAQVVIRPTGGHNAGHTIVVNGKQIILHIIPSSILHDKRGVVSAIGNGVVLYPKALDEDLNLLKNEGVSFDKLMIALNAKLIMPQHILMDRIKESDPKSGTLGTTGRGIGPAYTDDVARIGLLVNDLLNKDVLYKKIKRNLDDKLKILSFYDPALIRKIMKHEHLENGIYYKGPKKIFDVDAIVERYYQYGKEFGGMIRDVDAFVQKIAGKKRILLEGAQGDLLSFIHGSRPYVTSSDCTAQGMAMGAGLPNWESIDMILGILKAFVMTRVGKGPFPTEIGGARSDKWCNSGADREMEDLKYPHASINSSNPFQQGVALRRKGGEYGASTGRTRRVGWVDLPLARSTSKTSRDKAILTKLDVLDGCETIKICNEYIWKGPRMRFGERILRRGDRLSVAIPYAEFLSHCEPVYTEFPGYGDISEIRSLDDMPKEFKRIYSYVVKKGKIDPKILSVGADRKATIIL